MVAETSFHLDIQKEYLVQQAQVATIMEPCRPWGSIDALAFHENTIIMELLGRSQGPATTRNQRQIEKDHSDDCSVQHLLDDFALVASGAGGASNVAAACMEIGDAPPKYIVIRIAKNEDFTHQKSKCWKISSQS